MENEDPIYGKEPSPWHTSLTPREMSTLTPCIRWKPSRWSGRHIEKNVRRAACIYSNGGREGCTDETNQYDIFDSFVFPESLIVKSFAMSKDLRDGTQTCTATAGWIHLQNSIRWVFWEPWNPRNVYLFSKPQISYVPTRMLFRKSRAPFVTICVIIYKTLASYYEKL